jgi:hypothetical protein
VRKRKTERERQREREKENKYTRGNIDNPGSMVVNRTLPSLSVGIPWFIAFHSKLRVDLEGCIF